MPAYYRQDQKNREPGKKATLYLTDKARLKYISGRLEIPESNKIKKNTKRSEESDEERQQKLIQLILFFDAAENQIYEVSAYEKEKIEKILSVMGIHSLNDLSVEYTHRKNGDGVISTVYGPVSCIKMSKREIPSSIVIKKIIQILITLILLIMLVIIIMIFCLGILL